jgi:hypothetical protein
VNIDSRFDVPAHTRPPADLGLVGRALASGAVAVLVMAGVAGTVFNLAARDGWLVQLFGRSIAGGLAALLAFLIIGVCAVMVGEALTPRQRSRVSEFFVYGFALLGGLYVAQVLLKGGWI